MQELTLNQELAARNLTHRKAERGVYRHDIRDSAGRVLFNGSVSDVWAWMKTLNDSFKVGDRVTFPTGPGRKGRGTVDRVFYVTTGVWTDTICQVSVDGIGPENVGADWLSLDR